jgi:hypothetical protein
MRREWRGLTGRVAMSRPRVVKLPLEGSMAPNASRQRMASLKPRGRGGVG